MLEFKLRFPVKEDAEKLNEIICGWFQGSPRFINNDIVVTPVETKWIDNKLNWIFSVIFYEGMLPHKCINLEAGLMGLEVTKNLVWAVVKDTNNE